jgi:hypothetical protein
MPRVDLRAARANRDFCTDKERIRTEIAVMVKSKDSVGFNTRSPIADGRLLVRPQLVIRADGFSSAQD